MKKNNTFKKFILSIPEDVEYRQEDDYIFTLKTTSYEAKIEIFLHEEKDIMDYSDLYYDELVTNGIKVS